MGDVVYLIPETSTNTDVFENVLGRVMNDVAEFIFDDSLTSEGMLVNNKT